MNIKTILFDLDGTLIQTTELIIEAFKDTFNHYFNDFHLDDKSYENFLGQPLFVTFGEYEKDQDKINEMVHYYRQVSNLLIDKELKAYEGAKEVLSYLKKKGIQVGVVTSKMATVAKLHLEKTELYEYIDVLIGYEHVEHHKPDPEPILKALAFLNAKGSQTVYIGDHENDMIAAKKANVLACAVTYSARLAEMLSVDPEFVIDELMHVKDMI
jgi:HAD superfamily hydrolase (TIGR01549 family)